VTGPLAEPPAGIERDVSLARLTTIRTGGRAEFFARVKRVEELQRALEWAARTDLQVGVIGSGSNLLVADSGVRGLVLKLDGDLAEIELEPEDGEYIVCGGGARLPAVAAAAARAGLAGLEFGVSIPGTVGGAVRMNANAYGGALASVLDWVDVVSHAGSERRRPEALGLEYRRSSLLAGEVVARARFRLSRTDPESVRQRLAQLRRQRREAQPSGVRTFGSTFKNPAGPAAGGRTAGQLLDAAGCRGLRVGGARFSPKHANFIENVAAATTADVLALIELGRARVKEHAGIMLEPEVQVLGDVRLCGGGGSE
jgi:UDP-N-acetylenolpyruvoylglucosamine reductase